MKEIIPFLHMFPDYRPSADLQEAMAQATLVSADVDPVARRISVNMACDHYIPRIALDGAEREISRIYALNSLTPCFGLPPLPFCLALELLLPPPR